MIFKAIVSSTALNVDFGAWWVHAQQQFGKLSDNMMSLDICCQETVATPNHPQNNLRLLKVVHHVRNLEVPAENCSLSERSLMSISVRD